MTSSWLQIRTIGKAHFQKDTFTSTFDSLGVPLEYSKLEGPSTCLTFLGIKVDTEALQLRLPRDKLFRLKSELSRCCHWRSISKWEDIGSQPDHFIGLNTPARTDILWWQMYVENWNGISLLWDVSRQRADTTVTSDALGSWDCGALCKSRWFHFPWPSSLLHLPIAIKELVP